MAQFVAQVVNEKFISSHHLSTLERHSKEMTETAQKT
jgi:hypothetical protein